VPWLRSPLPQPPGKGHTRFTQGAGTKEGNGPLPVLEESLWPRSHVGKVKHRLGTTEELGGVCALLGHRA
jgi:hypothetical protein